MGVVFDEIDARVEGSAPPREQQRPAPAPAQCKPDLVRRELRRIEQRKARLKAD
jgi:hypothetical protein